MPGKFPKALIHIPESSAKQGNLKCLKPYSDLILEFSLKEEPVSSGFFMFEKFFKLRTLIFEPLNSFDISFILSLLWEKKITFFTIIKKELLFVFV